MKKADSQLSSWTFLSNHAHVLLCLAEDPEMVLKNVAAKVGITERAVQRIVADLEHAGYLERVKVGRRNRYKVIESKPLRHPIEAHETVEALLRIVSEKSNLTHSSSRSSRKKT